MNSVPSVQSSARACYSGSCMSSTSSALQHKSSWESSSSPLSVSYSVPSTNSRTTSQSPSSARPSTTLCSSSQPTQQCGPSEKCQLSLLTVTNGYPPRASTPLSAIHPFGDGCRCSRPVTRCRKRSRSTVRHCCPTRDGSSSVVELDY